MSLFSHCVQFHMNKEQAHKELMELAHMCAPMLPCCTKLEVEAFGKNVEQSGYSRRAVFHFPHNRQGASVVRHCGSYGGDVMDNLWEVGILLDGELDYSTPITSDVIPRCTVEEVRDILIKVHELPEPGPMKLWLLDANEHHGYDSYSGHVVMAKSEAEARKLCPYGCEREEVWLNPAKSTCVELVAENGARGRVILSRFHAG